MSSKGNLSLFMKKWVDYLNKDQEIGRRLKPFKTFAGGPGPVPGPGPYPRPTLAFDPTGWSTAKGYSSPQLDGNDVIQLEITGLGLYTLSLEKESFSFRETESKDAMLSLRMPLDLLKEILLTEQRVVWAFTDDRMTIGYRKGIALSDWITLLEILVIAQEILDKEPKILDMVEKL